VGQTLEVTAGSDRSWSSVLQNQGVPTPYPTSAMLDAAVWRGGEEAVLFRPTVTWIAAAAGSFTLAVAVTQTATLDPGSYRLQVGVTSGGLRSIAFDGAIEITDAPGAGIEPPTWCSSADMRRYSHLIQILVARKGVDVTGWLDERTAVTAELFRDLVLRYNPGPGSVRRRQLVMDPVLGFDVPVDSTLAPSPARVSAWLSIPGGLILEARVREIVARRSVALVLDLQATSGQGEAYRTEAEAQRVMADALYLDYRAQVDATNPPDGIADYLIDRSVILLPPGTAP